MSEAQKIPLARSLNLFAEKKVADAIQLTGRGLPCSVVKAVNSIITVKFEVNSLFTLPNITIPMFGPEYIRYPTQKGDKGVVIPFDARLSGVSGLGGGVADLSQPANLTALVFLPISNTAWSEVDPNAVTIYGPNGVVLRDEGSNTIFTLTPTSITMQAPDSVTLMCGGSEFKLTPTSYLISGSTGSISDGSHSTSAAIMNSIWALLETFLNTHTHPVVGSTTLATNTPYTGGSIAP